MFSKTCNERIFEGKNLSKTLLPQYYCEQNAKQTRLYEFMNEIESYFCHMLREGGRGHNCITPPPTPSVRHRFIAYYERTPF